MVKKRWSEHFAPPLSYLNTLSYEYVELKENRRIRMYKNTPTPVVANYVLLTV